MFEHKKDQLLPRPVYFRRLLRHAALGVGMMLACLGLGMLGYHHYEHLSWIDAYANAAMILSGMGPLASPVTTGGKLFAGTYAIFSGVAFLTTVGVLLAPVVHRSLHKFHLEFGPGR